MRAGSIWLPAVVVCIAAQGHANTDVEAFCAAEGGGAAAARQCVMDWLRSAELFLEYGKLHGHLDANGDYNFGKLAEQLFNWRTPLGIVTHDVYSDCAAAEAYRDFLDFRAVWDCIKAGDPEAAKLEAI